MPRANRCTICAHERRHQIEIGMVNRVSYRTLANRFQVSRDALYRHSRAHLPPQARAASRFGASGRASQQKRPAHVRRSSPVIRRCRLNVRFAQKRTPSAVRVRIGSVLWLAHQHIDDVLIVDGDLRHAVDPKEEFGAADAVSGNLLIRVRDLDFTQLPLDLAAPLGVGTHDATGTL